MELLVLCYCLNSVVCLRSAPFIALSIQSLNHFFHWVNLLVLVHVTLVLILNQSKCVKKLQTRKLISKDNTTDNKCTETYWCWFNMQKHIFKKLGSYNWNCRLKLKEMNFHLKHFRLKNFTKIFYQEIHHF